MIMSKLLKHVVADIRAGIAVHLISDSGRGKSMFVEEELLPALASADGPGSWGLCKAFGATYTPPDTMGYAFKGNEQERNGRKFFKTEFAMPAWFVTVDGNPAWEYKHVLIFLDEYGQSEAEVKRCLAELKLHRQIGPWAAPPGSGVIACSNKGPRYGVTKDFDFCINREGQYTITDDLQSLLDWMEKPYKVDGRTWEVTPTTRLFAKKHPGIVFEPAPKEQGPWCTPRSLVAQDRYMQVLGLDNINPGDADFIEGTTAKVGVPASQALCSWLQFRLELPDYEQVVAAPTTTPVPQKPDMMMLMSYELAALTQREHLPACVQYMQRFPKDMAICYVKTLLKRDASLLTEPAMQAWSNKNSTLISLVASLA